MPRVLAKTMQEHRRERWLWWVSDPDLLHIARGPPHLKEWNFVDGEHRVQKCYMPRPTSRYYVYHARRNRPIDDGDDDNAMHSDDSHKTDTTQVETEDMYQHPTSDQLKVISEISDREAYNGLIALGGRPSHPRAWSKVMFHDPGKYRDIINFWQDEPWEQNLFERQLEKWMHFRLDFQRACRTSSETFQLHLSEMKETLKRHGCIYPAWFTPTAPFFFRESIAQQDHLATWFEYLYSRLVRHEEVQVSLRHLHPKYAKACKALNKYLVQIGKKELDEETMELTYGNLPTHVIVGIIDKRAKLHNEQEYEEKGSARMAVLDKEIADYDKRCDAVAAFQHSTHRYRIMKKDVDRLRLLLNWTSEQMAILVKEKAVELGIGVVNARPGSSTQLKMNIATAPGPALSSDHWTQLEATSISITPRCHFMRLSAEIRQVIWEFCLPQGPTTHFFEVLEPPRKSHMLHNWSPAFRTCASKRFPSGYLAMYTLLAACRDSREFAMDFYRRRQQRFFEQTNGLSWGEAERSPWQQVFGNVMFETFHWIPGDDLVVLCFPPRQVSRLPEQHAITFVPMPPRLVGIFISEKTYLIEKLGPNCEGGRNCFPWHQEQPPRDYSKLIRPRINDADGVKAKVHKILDILRSRQDLNDPSRAPDSVRELAVGGIRAVHVFVNGTHMFMPGHFRHERPNCSDIKEQLGLRTMMPIYLHEFASGNMPTWNGRGPPRASWQLSSDFLGQISGIGPILDHGYIGYHRERGNAGDPILVSSVADDIADRFGFRAVWTFAVMVRSECEAMEWPEFIADGPRAPVMGLSWRLLAQVNRSSEKILS